MHVQFTSCVKGGGQGTKFRTAYIQNWSSLECTMRFKKK